MQGKSNFSPFQQKLYQYYIVWKRHVIEIWETWLQGGLEKSRDAMVRDAYVSNIYCSRMKNKCLAGSRAFV